VYTVSNERDLPTHKGGGGGFITLNEAYYRLYAAPFPWWLRVFVQKRPTDTENDLLQIVRGTILMMKGLSLSKRGQLTHQRDLLTLKEIY
jgi:hypothetical protein